MGLARLVTVLRGYVPGASEAWSRTVVKTALYRVLMVAVTVLVAYLFTGDTTDALQIGVAANVVKTATYYGYERLWARIAWGRNE